MTAGEPRLDTPIDEPRLDIHTSNRLDVLVEHLAGVLVAEPTPPLEREVIVVQSQGMVRWLTLQLADRLGIAASLSMPFPATFCRWLAQSMIPGEIFGTAEATEPSRFDREPLTWRIFDRLRDTEEQRHSSTEATATPATYLEDDTDQIKRYQLAVRLSGLFESYQIFRPRMLLRWQQHVDDPSSDSRSPVAVHHARWQSELWRSLLNEDHGRDPDQEDPLAHRMISLLETLRKLPEPAPTGPAHEGLPRRLSVFGASTLPPIFLEIAVALARFLPVRIYFLSPTYHYWGDLRSEREATRIRQRLQLRAQAKKHVRQGSQNTSETREAGPKEDHLEAGHPLLAALGRQGRDFFNLLQEADAEGSAWHELDLIEPGEDTLLHALQSDILHLVDRGSEQDPPHLLAASDDSLTLHDCHSPMREMEVLRDQLLDAFAKDPELKPSDVLVMTPRIGDYAPYIEAAFSSPPRSDTEEAEPGLPFTIADRQAREERPAADTVLRLLDLVGSRLTPRAVLDLLEVAAVRRAFSISSAEIPELRRWARESRIRWGMDGAQRAADFEVPDVDANTWRAGLDRLLMGYAAGPSEALVAGVAPLAGQTAGPVELLGRLADFTDVLFSHLRRLRDPRPVDRWASDLRAALTDLHDATTEGEESALELVLGELEELHQARTISRVTEPVSRQVIQAHLGRRLAAEGSGVGFLSGRITFCTLKPMRTLPFRVICLAGLDEGAFPRRDSKPGFDLIAAEPRPGDRSLAEDDRYLFLETLLAAGDRLILTFRGRSEKDNSLRAPSAVVSELLTYLDRAFFTQDGRPARQQMTVRHRLHPWNADYFSGESRHLFSYSQESFRLAQLDRQHPTAEPFLAARGEAEDNLDAELTVELPDLVGQWIHPAKFYCRQVLRLTLEGSESNEDAEPFEVDFLDRYRVSQWLLERRLHGAPEGEEELELLRAQGELPLADLGTAYYQRLAQRVDDFAATLPRPEPREPLLVELEGNGWHLQGRLDSLTEAGMLRYRCANLKPKDLMRAWVNHVVFAAWHTQQSPDLPLTTHLAGIDRSVRFGEVTDVNTVLESLIAGHRACLERPLPVFENASHAWIQQRRKSAGGRSKTTPEEAAHRAFHGDQDTAGESSQRRPGDLVDPYVALCWRDLDPLAESGFAHWAQALWTPLLDHLEEVKR